MLQYDKDRYTEILGIENISDDTIIKGLTKIDLSSISTCDKAFETMARSLNYVSLQITVKGEQDLFIEDKFLYININFTGAFLKKTFQLLKTNILLNEKIHSLTEKITHHEKNFKD